MSMALNSAAVHTVDTPSKPQDITICYHTKNYSSAHGVVNANSCGTPLPSPCLFVLFSGDSSHVHCFDSDGEFNGCIEFKLKVNTERVESIAVLNSDQQLFLADSRYHCVHITDLSGAYITQLGDEHSNLFSAPCGLSVDEHSDPSRLVVCDLEAAKVQVFALPSLECLFIVENASIMRPIYSSVSPKTKQIWVVNNKLFEPTSISIIEDRDVKRTVRIHHSQFTFTWPRSLAHDTQGNCFVADQHRLTQLLDDGSQVASRGSRDKGTSLELMDDPRGMCMMKHESGSWFIVLCDFNNRRLKFYKL